MIDKNQITIDGINVSECVFLDNINGRIFCNCCNSSPIGESLCHSVNCSENSNCYYKQLKRKEQECEALKVWQEANQPTGICETCTAQILIENDKYKRALNEIERYFQSQDTSKTSLFNIYVIEEQIEDIITKAKED